MAHLRSALPGSGRRRGGLQRSREPARLWPSALACAGVRDFKAGRRRPAAQAWGVILHARFSSFPSKWQECAGKNSRLQHSAAAGSRENEGEGGERARPEVKQQKPLPQAHEYLRSFNCIFTLLVMGTSLVLTWHLANGLLLT
jgi:hypothetical protein